MQILRKKFYCIDSQHDQRVTWLQTKNIFTDKFGTSQLNWAFCGFQTQLIIKKRTMRQHCEVDTVAT